MRPDKLGIGVHYRFQSAMEYLMTYGWAVLVIALILGTLYYLGLFNSPQVVNGCIAQPGFYCENLVFNANTTNFYVEPSFTMKIGITSTQPWTNISFVIVPEGQQITNTSLKDYENANDLFYWGTQVGNYYHINYLAQGEIVTPTIYVAPGAPGLVPRQITLGTKLTGTIWAEYTTSTGTNQVAEIAEFSTYATRNN